MTEKAQRTLRIKWVRSGIGFSHRAKEVIRSLGLRRLNHVVDRPDTPQVRGLIAKIPHLVEVLLESPALARLPGSEYTILPREAAPAQEAVVASAAGVKEEKPAAEPAKPQEALGTLAAKPTIEAATEEAPVPAKTVRAKVAAKPVTATRRKKPQAEETKKAKTARSTRSHAAGKTKR